MRLEFDGEEGGGLLLSDSTPGGDKAHVAEEGPCGMDKGVGGEASLEKQCLGPDDPWLCAICRGVIPFEDTAQLRGCEHAYCVSCILQWASHTEIPWCPQCRAPFSMLYSYRTLEGGLSDVMVEESVCLLLRAPWFKAGHLQRHGGGAAGGGDAEGHPSFHEERYKDYYEEYDDGGDDDEDFLPNTALRLGNRRFGETGFVRGGRMEARPAGASTSRGRGPGGSGGSRGSSKEKEKAQPKEQIGRRAKRAQKRDNGDSSAAGKHQQPRAHCGGRR